VLLVDRRSLSYPGEDVVERAWGHRPHQLRHDHALPVDDVRLGNAEDAVVKAGTAVGIVDERPGPAGLVAEVQGGVGLVGVADSDELDSPGVPALVEVLEDGCLRPAGYAP